mmetsp:Transcript_4122/g.9905  ORF Transcript_4122/g.9905 Transcript_4122/m.9905 type:complete len:201 (-) Transcript_4122:354-956(-)
MQASRRKPRAPPARRRSPLASLCRAPAGRSGGRSSRVSSVGRCRRSPAGRSSSGLGAARWPVDKGLLRGADAPLARLPALASDARPRRSAAATVARASSGARTTPRRSFHPAPRPHPRRTLLPPLALANTLSLPLFRQHKRHPASAGLVAYLCLPPTREESPFPAYGSGEEQSRGPFFCSGGNRPHLFVLLQASDRRGVV